MEALILNYINHEPVYINHLLKLCFKIFDKNIGLGGICYFETVLGKWREV